MFVIYAIYFTILLIYVVINALAINHVLQYRHSGDGTMKVVIVYGIIALSLIISSFITLISTDWDIIL